MKENLVPLKLPPGLYRNGTEYQAKDRWFGSNLVRFFEESIRPVGGWRRLQASSGTNFGAVSGCPRGSLAYAGDSGGALRFIIGTTTDLYVITAGVLTTLTPTATVLVTGTCQGSYLAGTGAYGAGNYGDGPYGGLSISSTIDHPDTWSLDNFGDSTVGVLTSDRRIFSWDGNTANRFVVVTNAPVNNQAVVVTPERFLVALGAGGDPRLVRWASQESLTDWTPSGSNSAGDFPLSTHGRLIAGRRTRRQTVLWTDVDVYTMTFIGGVLVYQFDQVDSGCGLIGPNAIAMVDTRAFWMGQGGFYYFDGFVRQIKCDVAGDVFQDLDPLNHHLIHAQTIAEFNEIWWFFPSIGASDNNRAVVWNYREDHWTIHTIARATGVDRGAAPVPIMVDNQGRIYEHEIGHTFEDYNQSLPDPNSVIFLHSGPVEVGNGDQVYRLQRIVPDEQTRGDLKMYFELRLFPTDTPTLYPGPSANAFISLDGPSPIDVRMTARQVSLHFTQNREVDWRLGSFRFAGRVQGRR